jgi:7-carboxy-7-deazaguanine synthase
MLKIVERYLTLGGEAPMSGDPVYIIRFSGCNLSCFYCDTKYNSEENEIISTAKLKQIIKDQILQYPGLKILFTGGEPLLNDRQHKLISIMKDLPLVDFFIETNGSFPITPEAPSNCHYIVDWKSPSSGEEKSFYRNNIEAIVSDRDCFKFVVNKGDLDWLKDRVSEIKKIYPELPLYVSPQWGDIEFKELADFIIENKLNISLSLQIHKIIWPPELRGV